MERFDSQILNNDIFNDIPSELCEVNKLKLIGGVERI